MSLFSKISMAAVFSGAVVVGSLNVQAADDGPTIELEARQCSYLMVLLLVLTCQNVTKNRALTPLVIASPLY